MMSQGSSAPQGGDIRFEKPENEAASRRRKLGTLHAAWAVVFQSNLIVPLPLGWTETHESGRVGMFTGIILLMSLGLLACTVYRRIGMSLTIGGIFVGLSQFFPILQFVAGAEAVGIAGKLGQANREGGGITSQVGGLIATLLTGGGLMSLALMIGLFFTFLFAFDAGSNDAKSLAMKPGRRETREEWDLM